jgi:hypothetical protein
LVGNAAEARQYAEFPKDSAGSDVQYATAVALAYARDDRRAELLTNDMSKDFPEDTIMRFNYMPTLHAKLAVSRGISLMNLLLTDFLDSDLNRLVSQPYH